MVDLALDQQRAATVPFSALRAWHPEAKAMPKSCAASSSAASSSAKAVPKVMSAKPKNGAASSSTAPPANGVWADEEDDKEFGVEFDEVY